MMNSCELRTSTDSRRSERLISIKHLRPLESSTRRRGKSERRRTFRLKQGTHLRSTAPEMQTPSPAWSTLRLSSSHSQSFQDTSDSPAAGHCAFFPEEEEGNCPSITVLGGCSVLLAPPIRLSR